jgi:hypothetical protein
MDIVIGASLRSRSLRFVERNLMRLRAAGKGVVYGESPGRMATGAGGIRL